ncbi:MAG: biopolymer transporter ExbD [Gammaproteobacteria bacterium]|nr:biopolymer transporter ExbD [Gammaproteobacteria bacterium]
MRSRFRRRATPIVDLDVTAFINLMVVLVAFFLSSMAYYQFSTLELNIPPGAAADSSPAESLELEIVIRKDALEVSNRGTGLIRRIDNTAGVYDFTALSQLLRQVKTRFPGETSATILAEADIPYETLIQAMDTARSYAVGGSSQVNYVELFPDLSVGDAPLAAKGGVAP